ncbi:D-aminoacyl-tRNA deacylase OS=Ureibacillus acetophenoni OX=614649 GN=dtd PE=3 SV=1 [Ureibacillus acetophenoni]
MKYVAKKVAEIRLWEDEEGKMNHSILEHGGDILSVSQFTLYAETKKGRRPSFIEAARPEVALPLYEAFNDCLREHGLKVETGIFGAMMDVSLINDGPVTVIVESK